MAITRGRDGVVKVGTNTIAEVVDWNLDQTADVIETTSLTATARTYTPGKTASTGSVTCNWDETDTAGQGAMTAGAILALNLYPEGDAGGDTYYSFNIIITSIGQASGGSDGIVSAVYGFTVSGAITLATV
tara:strand:- start:12036 stop:12428 length:393 start_codon:yes stop_codon:yes gene_type:complete